MGRRPKICSGKPPSGPMRPESKPCEPTRKTRTISQVHDYANSPKKRNSCESFVRIRAAVPSVIHSPNHIVIGHTAIHRGICLRKLLHQRIIDPLVIGSARHTPVHVVSCHL